MPPELPTDGRPVNFNFEPRRCGKAECRVCREGGAHGPYWYANWLDDDGIRQRRYCGRTHPQATPGTIPLVGI